MRRTLFALAAASCATPLPGLMPDPELADRTRDALETMPVIQEPACSVALDCPDLGITHARCVDDPTLFEVSVFGDRITEVQVIPERLAELALAPGTWYTVFPDPGGGCEATAIAFSATAEAM